MSERLRILLVDDDFVDREIVKRALHVAGLAVDLHEAEEAEAALDILARAPQHFELGLFDLQMPGRDGLELLTEMRARGHGMPVIFMTGHGSETLAVELMKAGASDYLPKASLSASRLQQSIGHVMRLARTERSQREAERALRESEASFRLLTENLPDAVVRFDSEGRHIYVNQPVPWSRFASGAEVIGKTLAEVGVDPTNCALIGDAIGRALRGESTQITLHAPETITMTRTEAPDDEGEGGEVAAAGEDGEAPADELGVIETTQPRWFEVRFAPERLQGGERKGEVASVLAIARDVTARVLHEREEQRRIEFEHQLIGIVSHDLRNPIGAITMSAKLLDKKLGAEREDLVVRAIDVLQSSAQRASRMIADILDFTKARLGGSIPVELEECDLAAVLTSLVAEARTAHPTRVIELAVEGTTAGPFDADRVAQAVSNLIGNALAYSPVSEPIAVRVSGTRSEVRVEVENRGTTIAPEVLPTLFQPFTRGPARVVGVSSSRSVGLGLFIVDQIVQAHRGRIEVESKDDVTVFRLILPRRTPSGRQRSLTPPAQDAVRTA